MEKKKFDLSLLFLLQYIYQYAQMPLLFPKVAFLELRVTCLLPLKAAIEVKRCERMWNITYAMAERTKIFLYMYSF